ncbi:sugar ABC transporter substrate-binding protein [Acetanaerobacterium elongatum]|uniref:Monosaccharide ABC transporter substrate-binding protein, CUT2 family n=1 Tax=Acetanaerobacterium elongatum TaxID=258515 RepID=A0A1G9USW7_9FIRM|nr:sugar ABC transporter substrate-binding protein [Acetanaerobacterium elongatum]SDM63001.1 monosaccharide ABC transporter substrate-binding protein, CUT2 family [Acetanaerobacterium elongatum]
MKKVLAFVLALVVTLSLAACSSGTAPTESAVQSSENAASVSTGTESSAPAASTTKGGHVFGYTCMDMTNPFHIAMRDAIKAAVEANGDKLIAIDGAMDQTKQNNAIDDLITQGIEALFLNPCDSKGVKPALEACKAANIPVINVDSGVADTDMIATFISSNNYQAGKLCGEEMVKLFPDGAKICIIENPLAESVVQRVKGLEDAIKGSKVEIVGRKSIATMDVVLSTAEDLLQAHPDISAFWGLNDDVSLTILGALQSAGVANKVKVFSVDGSPSAKKSIADKGLYATAAQSPVSIGTKAVECAYSILKGDKIEATYSIDTSLVTSENVAEAGTDSWK